MGIKGRHCHLLLVWSFEHLTNRSFCSVRRNTDPHLIHANVDTDIVISEENENGTFRKPEEMYRIIENFSLGRRRLELFGEVPCVPLYLVFILLAL